MNLSGLNVLLAEGAPGPGTTLAPDPTGANIKFFLMLGVMFVVMWFMFIQPQRKREKELKSMLGALKVGDKIVTTSGIIGVVLTLKDKAVTIRSSETKLEILKSSISQVTAPGADTAAS